MGEITLRFGKVSTSRSRFPSLNQIKRLLDRKGIIGSPGERNGIYRVVQEEDYLFGQYFKEVEEENLQFNDVNEVVEVEQNNVRTLRFFLLNDGTYAFESKRGISDDDVIPYIFESLDIQYEYDLYEEFSLDTMRTFYKNHEQIRKLKVNKIGAKEPNPHWGPQEITELTEDTGESTDNTTFSVGRVYENLKNADLIHKGFARLSNLQLVRAKDGDDDIEELRESGRLSTTFSETLDDDERREKIRDSAVRALQTISGADDIQDTETDEPDQ